jgi:hypothetical protein
VSRPTLLRSNEICLKCTSLTLRSGDSSWTPGRQVRDEERGAWHVTQVLKRNSILVTEEMESNNTRPRKQIIEQGVSPVKQAARVHRRLSPPFLRSRLLNRSPAQLFGATSIPVPLIRRV